MKKAYLALLLPLASIILSTYSLHAMEVEKPEQKPALYVHNATNWPIKIAHCSSQKDAEPIRRIIMADQTLEIGPIEDINAIEYETHESLFTGILPEALTRYSIDLRRLKERSREYSCNEVVEISTIVMGLLYKATWIAQDMRSEKFIDAYHDSKNFYDFRQKNGQKNSFLWPHTMLGLTSTPTLKEIENAEELYIKQWTKNIPHRNWPDDAKDKAINTVKQDAHVAADTLRDMYWIFHNFNNRKVNIHDRYLKNKERLEKINADYRQQFFNDIAELKKNEAAIQNYPLSIESRIRTTDATRYNTIVAATQDKKTNQIVWFASDEWRGYVLNTLKALIKDYLETNDEVEISYNNGFTPYLPGEIELLTDFPSSINPKKPSNEN